MTSQDQDSNGLPTYSKTIDDSVILSPSDCPVDTQLPPPPYSSGCITDQVQLQMENTSVLENTIPTNNCVNNNCIMFCKSATNSCCICGKEFVQCLGNLVIGIIVCPFVCIYKYCCETDPDIVL